MTTCVAGLEEIQLPRELLPISLVKKISEWKRAEFNLLLANRYSKRRGVFRATLARQSP